jgi:HD-like signal output (HDOD) protein/GGDEF domain-containing protein
MSSTQGRSREHAGLFDKAMTKDAASTIDRLVARAGQLYSLPTVAMKVLELTQNPTVDAHALKECIENDPALTIKLLRVVNSSLFGLSREVRDLNQALALLGTKPLKLLVLGFSLPKGLFAGVEAAILARYWRRTLTKAVAARELSETVWRQPGDEAFIAGLLQDLGMLLLVQELGEPYITFLDRILSTGSDLKAMEVESMGFDHTMLTARLLAHWGLPQTLVEAVNWPPDAAADMPQLAQVLHLTDLLAQLLVDGHTAALGQLLAADQPASLTPQQVETLAATLEQKVQQLAGVLRLQLPENTDHRELLLQAHAQLSEVASEAAEVLLRRQFHGALADDGGALVKEFQSLSEAVARVTHQEPKRRPQPVPAAAPASVETAPASCTAATVHAPAVPLGPTASLDLESELHGQLASVVAACRQSRCSVSLLLAELDNPDQLAARYGIERLSSLRRFLEVACRKLEHPCAICVPHGDIAFAVILPGCDRRSAVQLGNQLIDRVRQLGLGRSASGRPAVSVSAGLATVALPTKNFPPQDLIEAANRCLYGAHASGGVLKSIEIY